MQYSPQLGFFYDFPILSRPTEMCIGLFTEDYLSRASSMFQRVSLLSPAPQPFLSELFTSVQIVAVSDGALRTP
jgi:hypothetical protein